jgi:hypothetical protein
MGATFPLVSSKSVSGFILTCEFVSHFDFDPHVGMETYNVLIDVIRLVMATLELLVAKKQAYFYE